MPSPAEPELTNEERLAVARAVAQFNRGFYFECHDTLEDVWSGLRGPSRGFFQGLIQVSVGFYHLGRGNGTGALSMFTRALRRFETYPVRYFGFDVEAERTRLRELSAALTAEGGATPEEPPCWCFEDLPPVAARPLD